MSREDIYKAELNYIKNLPVNHEIDYNYCSLSIRVFHKVINILCKLLIINYLKVYYF